MRLFELIGKGIVLSIIFVLANIQWMLTILVGISSVILKLLAGLFLVIAMLSVIVSVMTWTEALKPLLGAIIAFAIPMIGQGIIAVVILAREALTDFVWS